MKHTLEVRRELISFAAEQPCHAVEGRGGLLSSSVMVMVVGSGVGWGVGRIDLCQSVSVCKDHRVPAGAQNADLLWPLSF